MNRFISLAVAALVAFLAASCETTEVAPNSTPDANAGHGRGDRNLGIPRVRWELNPAGSGYDLDLVLAGEKNHIATGGEYMSGRRVSRSSRNVPAGTMSAFEVLLPDGEIDLFWAEEGREGTLIVYRKSYDALDDVWSSERRMRSVNY